MRRPVEPRARAVGAQLVGELQEQVGVLQSRLAQLTAEAGRNEALFLKTQERELELLRAGSLAQLLEQLIHGLRNSYQLASVTLTLRDPQHEVRQLLTSDGFALEELPQLKFVDTIESLAPQLRNLDRPWLGPLRRIQHERLLQGKTESGSLALIPLRRNNQLDGVLVFASEDRQRFTRELASDFLARLGVVAAICLENAINRARLVRSGLTDFLTGFHNRRYLQARLCEELARAHRDAQAVTCLMIDVDHFKQINDRYGHLAGDAVLREVARRIEAEMRLSDTGARFGGDEFAIVLPHGNVADGERVAHRVLETVRAQPFPVGNQTSEPVSLSIGVAAAAPAAGAARDYHALAERLIAAADQALYQAKQAGRNRVVAEPAAI